jgi:pilus assembly protein Flp/PilA
MIDKSTTVSLRFRDDEGATATEYIVLLVFIALAIIVGAGVLGTALNDKFDDAGDRITNEVPGD